MSREGAGGEGTGRGAIGRGDGRAGDGRRSRVARLLSQTTVPVGVASLVAIAIVGVSSIAGGRAGEGAGTSVGANSAPDAAAPMRAALGVQDAASAVRAAHSVRRPRAASGTLRAADGTPVGWVKFKAKGTLTAVQVKIKLSPGMSAMDAFHGFHIHANDKPENGEGCLADPAQPPATWFVSADGHLAEPGQKHSHHAGDMPSVLVNDDGSALLEFTTGRLAIADLQNRAVVLHAGPDNFANVPTGAGPDQYTANSTAATDKSAATGNAGDRIACGVLSVTR